MTANTYGRQVVIPLTNKSGGSVAAGDVVVVDTTNNDAFTTDTSGGFTGGVGIAQETIASNATGRVLIGGYAALVNVNASVTRGQYGKTHTVAKQATGTATRGAGTFCQWLTGGTTPDAIVYPVDLGAATFSGCRASRSATQSITNATETAVNLTAADDYDTDNYHFTSAANLTGTVSKTSGSATITGSGTSFTTELTVNQVIDIPGTANDRCVVTAIANNTSLTVAIAPVNTAAGQTATRVNSCLAIPAGKTGKFGIKAEVQFANNTTGTFRLIRIYAGLQSTVATLGPLDGAGPFNTNVGTHHPFVDDYPFTAGDWIEVRCYQDSGGALNLSSARIALQFLGA